MKSDIPNACYTETVVAESMKLVPKRGFLMALRLLTYAIARIPGGVWCVYALRRVLPRPKGHIRIADFDGDLAMYVRLDENMQSQIFWHGCYSRGFAKLLNRILVPGMTVIDAGANVGEITLLAAKRVGSTGRVLAFEPVPEIASCLSTNIEANEYSQVTVMQSALSDKEGEYELYRRLIPTKDGSLNDGLGSLFPGHRDGEPVGTTRVRTLDSCVKELALPKVDLIKMDIEGAELPALHGAADLLSRDRPILIIEVFEEAATAAGYSTADVFGFLSDYGYEFETMLDNGDTRPTNLLCLERIQNVLCLPRNTVRRD